MRKIPDHLNGKALMVIFLNLVIPGSGYVLLGRPIRGLVMLFWMVIFGYVTYNLSSPETSFIGRISGGLAIWALSAVEIYRISAGNIHK